MLWHIENKHLKREPLNKNLFAYQEGMSTETALHKVTDEIEKALTNKEIVLAANLDISGAFNNTSTKSLTRPLR